MGKYIGPATLLVGGRAIGLAASFAIGIVLARVFDPADFGTYKQFFLVFATLYGIAQLGMAESLYYFVPRNAGATGRYVCNAMVTLALGGLACLALLYTGRAVVARWLSNTPLAEYIPWLGVLLTLTLVTTVFEIVMISRKRHMRAAITYAVSDICRTLMFVLPAVMIGSLRAVFIGATAFVAVRCAVMLAAFWREFGGDLRIDLALWRDQLAYALPFALAVTVEIVQINFHQYAVAARVDAATFAVYAIGCMQIPLVDLIVTSTVNVLMVRMAEESDGGRAALALWHDTLTRLAFLLIPLATFLTIMARPLIVGLFTETYARSADIFRVWALAAVLPPVFAVDGVLRVYAQTRFLLLLNILRLAIVAATIGMFISAFGLQGAVAITLLATMFVKLLGVARLARLMRVPLLEALPWGRLAVIVLCAALSIVPVLWLTRMIAMPPLASVASGAALYGATYFGLSYAARRFTAAPRQPDFADGAAKVPVT
jgi:O-antigen/teichoic acid export membrane protein